MKRILVSLVRDHGDSQFNTADLEWFRRAIDSAAGHSGVDYVITIGDDNMSCSVDIVDGD